MGLRLAIAIAVALAACGGREAPKGRVFLIGIDGASPRLAEEWIAKGLLPHLAEIARTGVSGTVRAPQPLLSPRIWTSVATGKAPEKHGIRNWVRRDPGGTLRLFKSHDRTAHALWNIASDAGLRVAVINWLNTYPPEVVEGVMVSDFAIPGERQAREDLGRMFAEQMSKGAQKTLPAEAAGAGTTHPAAWEETLRALATESAADPLGEPDGRLRESLRKLLSRSLRTDRLVVRAALAAEREIRPDLLMVYLPGIDRVSHFLWGALEPPDAYPERLRFAADEREAAAAALRAYYQVTDGWIGEIVARAGPEDLVWVVSDHGFEARFREGLELTGGHDSDEAAKGVLFVRGALVAAKRRVSGVSVDDVTPSILAWLGLPAARDMDGRPAGFLDVDPAPPIATYDTAPIERVQRDAEEVEETIIEHLRGLGYVEE